MSLDAIGVVSKTDKSSIFHDYLRSYEALFGDEKQHFTSILEIGVQQGHSLRMWREWMPQATIVGVDRNVWCAYPDGCIVEIANAADPEQIEPVAMTYGPFDLIIDDGSHIPEEQHAALDILWPYLKDGGYYIIEDVPHGETRFGGTAVCGDHRDERQDFVWRRKNERYRP